MERIFIDEDDRLNEYTFQRYDDKILGWWKTAVFHKNGMWTDGDVVEMDVRISRLHKWDGLYLFEFSVASILDNQEVRVSCADRELETWRFKGIGLQAQRLMIPEELVVNGVAKLKFRMKSTLCPAEMGTSTDKRHLGIRFLSARLIGRNSDFGGKKFSFTSDDGNVSRQRGFSVVEPKGTWTDADSAVMGLRLKPECASNGQYRISFFVAPVLPDQSIRVYCGGRELAVWQFDNGRVQKREVVVPESMIRFGEATLEFRMKNTLCPREKGLSNDTRHLGLLFVSAELLDKGGF